MKNNAMEITKLLHHRPPYLLLSEVLKHDKSSLTALSLPNLQDFYLQGHFPETPVVPGAIMQEMTVQAAGLLITHYYAPVENYDSQVIKGWALGVLRAIYSAKFKHFARPGDQLQVQVHLTDFKDHLFRLKGHIKL